MTLTADLSARDPRANKPARLYARTSEPRHQLAPALTDVVRNDSGHATGVDVAIPDAHNFGAYAVVLCIRDLDAGEALLDTISGALDRLRAEQQRVTPAVMHRVPSAVTG